MLFLNASFCTCPHSHYVSWCASSRRGTESPLNLCTNFISYVTMLISRCTAVTSSGISTMARTLSGWIVRMSPEATCPMNGASVILSCKFSVFSYTFLWSQRSKNLSRFLSSLVVASIFEPHPITAKSFASTSTLAMPPISSCIFC